jgi:MarR-like DNA-binding transcriptional regulator SgrR of sgrS sRNA
MRADASQWMNSSVRMLVFDSLTQLDDAGNVQPGLALRWDSQSDDRRWQLWLRADVRFHDGTPLSAATVVQSLTAQDCSACPWRSVHVSGDSVVFESETPVPSLPALLANSRYAITRKDENGNPVGTGPFRFTSIANGVVTLTAVDDSWRARPYVNAIELRGGRSLRDQWMDVGVGRADVVEVPAELLRRAQQEHMRLLTSRDSDLIALLVDENDPAAHDPRMREALALSIDRAALFNVVFQKEGEISASLLPNWASGYAFAWNAAPNVAKARELRSQVEKPQDLIVSEDGNDPVLQLIADRIALNARDAGITVRSFSVVSHPALVVKRIHLEVATPAAALDEVVNQLAPGERAPADDVVAVFHQEQELLANHTIIPLLYTPRSFAYAPRVHDLVLTPDGSIRAADFWLEDAK